MVGRILSRLLCAWVTVGSGLPVMTRPEAITAINDIALRLIDLLRDIGVEDTSPAATADAALQALGVTALEIDAVS